MDGRGVSDAYIGGENGPKHDKKNSVSSTQKLRFGVGRKMVYVWPIFGEIR